jgi:hypothetical protein
MMMQTDASSEKPEHDCPKTISHVGLTCDKCGKALQKPILARVVTGVSVQTYPACPHCMTRIRSTEALKEEERKPEVLRKGSRELDAQPMSDFTCGHFFGYLNKRQKGTSIPEPCLVCTKMVECLCG